MATNKTTDTARVVLEAGANIHAEGIQAPSDGSRDEMVRFIRDWKERAAASPQNGAPPPKPAGPG